MINFEYHSREEADKALKYWGNLIIKAKDFIKYVAVVKGNELDYKLEAGTGSGEIIDINEVLEEVKTKINYAYKVRLTESLINEKNLLKNINIYSLSQLNYSVESIISSRFIIKDINETHEETSLAPSSELRGGIHIGHFNQPSGGTLGGVFELEDFPDELFGISNWHVLADYENLGTEIFQPSKPHYTNHRNRKSYLCGNLFWKCLSKEREVAFVHFNKSRFNKESINTLNNCGYTLSGGINIPRLSEGVKKCGYKTNCKTSTLYSDNAMVKVYDTTYPKNEIIFKNQLMIKDRNFSESGDSGSLLVNNYNEVIGLIFAKTENGTFTVANNINKIFNTFFNISQEVLINQKTFYVNKFKLKRFH